MDITASEEREAGGGVRMQKDYRDKYQNQLPLQDIASKISCKLRQSYT